MKTVTRHARAVAPAATAAVAVLALVLGAQGAPAASKRSTTAKITGGHVTDARDGGRPVVLIAAALGVPAEVFREAFSAVTPAAGGQEPDPEQVQANKAALLEVLAPYGVTNERLDEVSDYYRYNGSAGEVWRRTAATARAVVRNGKVVSVRIVRAGAGYSSTPRMTLARLPEGQGPRDGRLRHGPRDQRPHLEAHAREGLTAATPWGSGAKRRHGGGRFAPDP